MISISVGRLQIQSHPEFFRNLPTISMKRFIANVVIIVVLGALGSLLFLGLFHGITGFRNLSPDNLITLPNIISQNLPFFLLTNVLFYRGKLYEQRAIIFSRKTTRSVVSFIATLVLMFLIGYMIQLVTSYNGPPETLANLEMYLNNVGASEINLDWAKGIANALLIMMVIAAFEEYVFRYTLYRHLRKKGIVFALVASALMFAFIHSGGVLGAFLFGVIIALYYEHTNNFWGAVALHAVNNVFLVFYTYLAVYHTLLYIR